jgi:hypothetical protein
MRLDEPELVVDAELGDPRANVLGERVMGRVQIFAFVNKKTPVLPVPSAPAKGTPREGTKRLANVRRL